MLLAGLEPATPAGKRTQIHASDCAASGTGTPSIAGTGTPSIAPTKLKVLAHTNITAAPPTRFGTTECTFFRVNIPLV
jgi:hypothetical protein